MRKYLLRLTLVIPACVFHARAAEPADAARALSSTTCSTSGCHGGAGPGRGAHTIWKRYDPHFNAAATLKTGRSDAMARQLGIDDAATAKTCTICHSPLHQPEVAGAQVAESGVSCANCHGPADKWLLPHTRPDYPKAALATLGMRPLDTAYQRANNCVACHQNLGDDLVKAKHPPLVFELDGMLVAQPKHWREEKDFSNAGTWLVGQAVALREAAAQAKREPGGRRTAEIEAITALLKASGTGWENPRDDLVTAADSYAKRISAAPMGAEQGRGILSRLLSDRSPFQPDAFPGGFRLWAVACYAERLALAIDRLDQAIAPSSGQARIDKRLLDGLFDAAKPPEAFDEEAAAEFVKQLDLVARSRLREDNDR